MKILNYNNENFFNELKSHLLKRLSNTDNKIDNIVKNIILDVKENGDIALIKYAKNLDNVDLSQSDIKLRSIKCCSRNCRNYMTCNIFSFTHIFNLLISFFINCSNDLLITFSVAKLYPKNFLCGNFPMPC